MTSSPLPAAAAGGDEARARWYANVVEHMPLIDQVCGRLFRRGRLRALEPKEAAQIAALALLRVTTYRAEAGSLAGFVAVVAERRVLLAERRRQRERRAIFFSDLGAADGRPWEHGAAALGRDDPEASDADLVPRLLGLLPRRERELVRRVVLEGATQEQAGRAVGVSRTRADQMLRRALDRLRRHLEQRSEPARA